MKYLEKEEFYKKSKELEGGHWTRSSLERRWEYHARVVNLVKSLIYKKS